jgi:hypothetical protein
MVGKSEIFARSRQYAWRNTVFSDTRVPLRNPFRVSRRMPDVGPPYPRENYAKGARHTSVSGCVREHPAGTPLMLWIAWIIQRSHVDTESGSSHTGGYEMVQVERNSPIRNRFHSVTRQGEAEVKGNRYTHKWESGRYTLSLSACRIVWTFENSHWLAAKPPTSKTDLAS